MQALQRRLRDEVADGEPGALVLCEHPPMVTVGRQGSHAHLDLDDWEDWRGPRHIRWINRAGGCWLHLPGQLAVYSILPLRRFGWSIHDFVVRLQQTLVATVKDYELRQPVRIADGAVWIGGRPIACWGGAVRDWITYYGAILNLNPSMEKFRMVRTGRDHPPMTSLQCEARRPIRASMARERLIEHFAQHFGFAQTTLFMEHPLLERKAYTHAIAAAR